MTQNNRTSMRLTPFEGPNWGSGWMLRESDGKFVQGYHEKPSLSDLRAASREYGDPLDRLDVIESDLSCTNCKESIDERFAADYQGTLLCWDCANGENSIEPSNTVDPAKVTFSDSALHHKSLCDYVINVATGCSHGCKFCYVPSTPNITARKDMLEERADVENSQREWGSYLLYRDDLPERLARKLDRKRTWNHTERGRGMVMISSGTDCYQDRRASQITRGCVIELVKRGVPVRILTRSPAVVRDLDVFERAMELSNSDDGPLIRVGSSIPCLDDEQVRAIEPGAPAPSARYRALKQLSDNDIPVYVSMSPTYPTQKREDFDRLFRNFAKLSPEVVFHEPINPRGGNFDMTIQAAKDAGQNQLASQLKRIQESREEWISYSIRQMELAEEMGEKHDVNVHIWPDKQVINAVESELAHKLKAQREAVSPEQVPIPSLSG